MGSINYLTEEGLKKLREEIEHLKSKERPKISQQIAEARDKGDLSENAEYDAAKETQGLLELKISKLEKKLANARVIDESQLDTSKVVILSTVKLKNMATNKGVTYTLVPEDEVDLKSGKISINTPIATGLVGKEIGDEAEIKLPNGRVLKFKILNISI